MQVLKRFPLHLFSLLFSSSSQFTRLHTNRNQSMEWFTESLIMSFTTMGIFEDGDSSDQYNGVYTSNDRSCIVVAVLAYEMIPTRGPDERS